MKISTKYELLFPPKEIFLNGENATWDWDSRKDRLSETSSYELPEGGGILFRTKDGNIPFSGFPFPPATQEAATWKRLIIAHLGQIRRYPWLLLSWRSFLAELEEVSFVGFSRYYLKSSFYRRPLRELYRVLRVINVPEWLVHGVCSMFQWDSAYCSRLQHYVSRMSANLLKANPSFEIYRTLKQAENTDANPNVQEKWRTFQKLFIILWIFSRKFRKMVRVIAENVEIKEFRMDKNEEVYAYRS